MNISSVSSTTITRFAPVVLESGTAVDFEHEACSEDSDLDNGPAATLEDELPAFWTARGRGRGAMVQSIAVGIFEFSTESRVFHVKDALEQ